MTVFINSSAQEAGYYDVGVKQKSQFHLSIIQQNSVFYATQECLVLLWKSTSNRPQRFFKSFSNFNLNFENITFENRISILVHLMRVIVNEILLILFYTKN